MRFVAGWELALPLMAVALTAAALISFLVTPLIRRVAHHFHVVDQPDPRRVNRMPVPRGGGLAVAAAFVPVMLVLWVVNGWIRIVPAPALESPELVALLLGGVAAVGIGALDDYLQLRARYQLAGQLVLALGAVTLGITIDFVANPFGPGQIVFGEAMAIALTVVWIVGMINSINFIDGLDGLSSGIGVIAALTLGVISLTPAVGAPWVAIPCFALAGGLIGFLRWNFHPASIFVGTSGVMFVGYTLAVLSILGVAKVAVAMLVLAVPIIDAFWIIVRRLARKRSPFVPDRGHLHHRLLDVGLSQTQTVVLIYALCIGLAVLTFVLSGSAQLIAFAAFVLIAGLALYGLSRRTGRNGSGAGSAEPADEVPITRPEPPLIQTRGPERSFGTGDLASDDA